MKKNFNYYIDIFLKKSYIKNKRSTYSTYKYTINKHILPYFNTYTCKDIDINIIIQFINNLSSKGLKNKSIKDILIILHEILKIANINIDIPYPKVINNNIKTLSLNDQLLLEKELSNNITPIKLGIYLSLYTGIRIGELCALNLNDIDINNKKIYIRKTLVRVISNNSFKKTTVILDSPKTINSIREIPIPNFIIPLFNIINYKDNTYLLTNTNKYIDTKTLTYHYKKLLKKLNINNYTFHTLRHTFATRCINEGCDPKTLSEILGHSNIRITLERYFHPNYINKINLINKLKPLC